MVSDHRLTDVDNILVLIGSPERRRNQKQEQETLISTLPGSSFK